MKLPAVNIIPRMDKMPPEILLHIALVDPRAWRAATAVPRFGRLSASKQGRRIRNRAFARRVAGEYLTAYYLGGRTHREDGPAIEYANGRREWYHNGQLHRKDGPAMVGANGDAYWCRYGQVYREEGPEFADTPVGELAPNNIAPVSPL